MRTTIRLTIIALLAALLNACATSRVPQQPINYQIAQLPESSNTYLSQAASAPFNQQVQYQLLAATRMLQDGETNAAIQELKKIPTTNLQSAQYKHYSLLKAYLALKLGNVRDAVRRVEDIGSVQALPANLQLMYHKVAYFAYQRSNYLTASVISEISIARLENNQNPAQLESIWENLQNLSTKSIQRIATSSPNALVRGWFALGLIAKQSANKPSVLAQAIQNWQQTHPNHPANRIIPSQAVLTPSAISQTPPQIALLLPLTGKFANMGKAVRDGFMTAYYAKLKTLGQAPRIKVYDTNKQNILTLYQQAVSQGANFVIGPLTKNNVATLASSDDINVPTLALNYSYNGIDSSSMIEFGLSPQQAAKEAANAAWQHGVSKALTITPDNDWGQSVFSAFAQQWQANHGLILSSLSFQDQNLADQIAKLLQIDQSQARAKNIETLTGKKLYFTPRRRLDSNGIFLVANPVEARQIHPLLEFYFAGRLPIFSTPFIYSGYPDPARDRDLNGIYFTDMPWILSNTANISHLRNQIKSLWPSNFRRYNRLYGLGVDTFTLSQLYHRLVALPNFGVNGVTGRLYLKANQQIYRHLLLAQFKRGRATLVNT